MSYVTSITTGNRQEFFNGFSTATASVGSFMQVELPGSVGFGRGVATDSIGYYVYPAGRAAHFTFAGIAWSPQEKTFNANTNLMMVSGGFCPKAYVSGAGPNFSATIGTPIAGHPDPTSATQADGQGCIIDISNPVYGAFAKRAIALEAVSAGTSDTIAVWVEGGW